MCDYLNDVRFVFMPYSAESRISFLLVLVSSIFLNVSNAINTLNLNEKCQGWVYSKVGGGGEVLQYLRKISGKKISLCSLY